MSLQAASSFADPAFETQWKAGEAAVPNFWGPLNLAHDGQQERYTEASGGTRLVQYFDKARMELTNPATGVVTNGLLTVELSTGRMQLGDATFEQRTPAHINVAGDPGSDSVTYADLTRLPYKPGRAYVCTNGPTACTEQEDTGNPIAPMFAAYIDRVGLLTVGLPITSPFLMTVNIAGQRQQVWGQAFERRVLTLAGELPNTRIEFGNIGQHYYQWRYSNGAPSASAVAVMPGKQVGPDSLYPNPSLTPGDVFPGVTAQEVCISGYTKGVRNVSSDEKRQVARNYGYTGSSSDVEYDHFIPLELGGSNAVINVWPEPIADAHMKDKVENALHAQVCNGSMTLQQAQDAIRTDWLAVSLKITG